MKADKKTVLRQLKTAKGQLEGIIRMVEEDRYCMDITNQILASKAILSRVEGIILKAHMESCIMDAALLSGEAEKREKINELTDVLLKAIK